MAFTDAVTDHADVRVALVDRRPSVDAPACAAQVLAEDQGGSRPVERPRPVGRLKTADVWEGRTTERPQHSQALPV